MESGFTRNHFTLLDQWGYKPWTATPEQKIIRDELKVAYHATETWAEALKQRLFPDGRVAIRKSVINQGKNFTPYNWARIYPHKSAHESLAYTVGIDQSGYFIVKIDTYKAPPDLIHLYQELRGPSYGNSPIAATISADEGLSMSFEQLVDWGASAIGKFAFDYNHVALRLGLARLRLLDDSSKVRDYFAKWRAQMTEDAIRQNGVWWIPDARIVLDISPPSKDGRIHTSLGVDPKGQNWSVEINEPRVAGSQNSLSAIAIDAMGQLFLLRQGWLRRNNMSPTDISGLDFTKYTGLRPAMIESEGSAETRDWFIVAALDQPAGVVRRSTGRFVDCCVTARSATLGTASKFARQSSELLFGADEKGGIYAISAKAALDEKTVLRRHGIVWLKLMEILTDSGCTMRKPRHLLGHEVDAEILPPDARPLLIEIKTGVSASDLYEGVGQLHVYRKLMPGLSEHQPILLLPETPVPQLLDAIRQTGVAVHTFSLVVAENDASVSFEPAFLKKCGQ